MSSRNQENSANSRTPGSALISGPISARAARIGPSFGHRDNKLAHVISEEEDDVASSITWLFLEYIVIQLSKLPQGSTRTAGTFVLFFDFLIKAGGMRISCSPSAVGHYCKESRLSGQRDTRNSLAFVDPAFAREMMIIIFMAIN